MENFSFNTSVARLMELLNALTKYDGVEKKNNSVFKDCFKKFLLLLAPCAPHFVEELWHNLGNNASVFHSKFPVCDEKALVKDEVEVAVQINSKMRTKVMLPNGANEDTVREIIFADEKLAAELDGKQIKKLIIVPNRLINVIV